MTRLPSSLNSNACEHSDGEPREYDDASGPAVHQRRNWDKAHDYQPATTALRGGALREEYLTILTVFGSTILTQM